ncbi:cytochrome P450 [Dentipellis sp. KUC8613]|nr:cytochrome P450 [Dentipellis sp. KUC8613]
MEDRVSVLGTYLSILFFSFVCLFFVARLLRTYGSRRALYPPGPPTLPILGNLLTFPRRLIHIKFSEWARQYGDVFSLKVMDQTIIVLNTPTLVRDVLEKKGSAVTGRPESIVLDRMVPHRLNFALRPDADDTWKAMRKVTQNLLSKENLKQYESYQQAEMTQTMVDILREPQDWFAHLHRYTASLTFGLLFGKRSPRTSSPDVRDFLHENPRFMALLEFGEAPPVDLFPALRYVPQRWAGWKREADAVRRLQGALYERLVGYVRARVERGMTNGAWMEGIIRGAGEEAVEANADYYNYLGSGMMEGAETTSPVLHSLVLLATAFPDKQQKAAEEIERVVGAERMPTLEDLKNLPYTKAFVCECIRFFPVAGLALPHQMTQDKIIDGILYPRGAVIFQNTYFMFHDERYFACPHEFVPERFLEHPHGVRLGVEDDPARRDHLLFGAGRRVCPGYHLARTSIDLCAMHLFWAFKLSLPLDPITGKQKPANLAHFKDGLATTPLPFTCDIACRSPRPHRADVMQEEFTRAAEFLRPFEMECDEGDRGYNARYRDVLVYQ